MKLRLLGIQRKPARRRDGHDHRSRPPLDDSDALAQRMSKAFPWMLALSSADRDTCMQAPIDAAPASFSTDQPHLAIAEPTSRKETATAVAAGLGSADLEWLEGGSAVERP
jgi:hypothetical protein